MTPKADIPCLVQPSKVRLVRMIGRRAAAVLADGFAGRVLAVFRRCFYVEGGDGALACLGTQDIGPGSLNALYDDDGNNRLPSGVLEGAAVRADDGLLLIDGRPSVGLLQARSWRPEPGPAGWSIDSVRRGLGHLAAGRLPVPRDGFGPLLSFALDGEGQEAWLASQPIGRCAGNGLAALSAWLEWGLGPERPLRPVPDDVYHLVGLGPGLTPSGDDFLGGVLITLGALGEARLAHALGQWLGPSARRRTGTISRAHLACAAAGEGAAALHSVLNAVIIGRPQAIDQALPGIATIGHTSGWDALAGAATALATWVHARDHAVAAAA